METVVIDFFSVKIYYTVTAIAVTTHSCSNRQLLRNTLCLTDIYGETMPADRCMGLNKNGSIEDDDDIPLEVIHIATNYTSENASHLPMCYWRSMRFDGQVSVDYYESDKDESDEVVHEVESEKQVEKENSVI
jgi:hypothetical protein